MFCCDFLLRLILASILSSVRSDSLTTSIVMAGFTFKGEVNSLSPRQIEFIADTLQKRGYKDNEVTIQTLGQAGDNYIANVKRITATGTDGSTFKLVAKVAPTNEIARARAGIPMLFRNESLMYEEILPKLVAQQKAIGLSDDQLLKHAECYGTLLEAPHELILLEDLQLSNYVILDRFKPITDKSVKLILKNFAILHSLSLVLKKENAEIFATFNESLVDFFGVMNEAEEYIHYVNQLEKDALDVLDKEDYKSAVRNSVSRIHEESARVFKDQCDLKQSVIIQGDGWTNNIMFRLKDQDPVDCIMIDYQLSKVSNPVTDILYMIFNCTDHETRRKHYYEWIDYYHSELDRSLAHFGITSDTIYTKKQLDVDLKKYSRVYFCTSIMLFSILIRKTEDAAKIKQAIENGDDIEEMAESFKTTNLDEESVTLFRNKIEGLIDSFREFGYID